MGYFDWLNSLVNIVAEEIENQLGKKFNRHSKLEEEAIENSKKMHQQHIYFYAPRELPEQEGREGKAELVVFNCAYHTDEGIKDGLKKIAGMLLQSDKDHKKMFASFSNLGAGIVVENINHQMIEIYFTVRLS
ncbi:MAG: hypothetical protein Athens101410_771 [Parcubacteria group bacterium Athens1014_10]|nr:MAG: hypothetical protein Athens101410_771 [Parcubacteria group bacterium Athens1014_10]TSD04627.1 MAG: hypothetical protein Athens071412_728 [Parcubacteria group bacterium Athens0714_12]